MKNIRDDLVHKELSYDIVGVLIEVYKHLGSGHREIYYQRGIAEELKRRGMKFQEQVRVIALVSGDVFLTWGGIGSRIGLALLE
jgi:hypothetical protein